MADPARLRLLFKQVEEAALSAPEHGFRSDLLAVLETHYGDVMVRGGEVDDA